MYCCVVSASPPFRHYELKAANDRIIIYTALTNFLAARVRWQERRAMARDKPEICVHNPYFTGINTV
jgi:hypothetical protein